MENPAQILVDEVECAEMSDTLLQNFSKAQKQYIIKHIYPEIGKALIHFISEAKRRHQIIEPDAFGKMPIITGEQS